MKKIRLSALVLTGAMVFTMTACSSKEPEATSTPENTDTPNVVESISPTAAPEPTESVNVIVPPAETDVAVAPLQTQTPDPTEGSKVQAVWEAVSAYDLPFFMDFDDDLLSALYGIDAADLVEYVGKTPMMNTQATEFFIAQVQSGKMDTVKAALEKRQADLETQWAQYLPEQLELVQNYKLVTNGDYVMFAVTEYADDAVTEFNTYTK